MKPAKLYEAGESMKDRREAKNVSAVGSNHLEGMHRALQERTRDGPQSEQNCIALITAAMVGDTAAAAELLNQGAEVDSRDQNGRTPLIEAAFGGHHEMVALLLERGAMVNAMDADGWTALMEASSKGRTDMVRLLLNFNADPTAVGDNGWTAIKLAARGNCKLVKVLRKACQARATTV